MLLGSSSLRFRAGCPTRGNAPAARVAVLARFTEVPKDAHVNVQEFQKLIKWAGGEKPPAKLAAKIGPHGGGMLVAEADIAKGQGLVAVPAALLMTLETCKKASYGALVSKGGLSEWQAMILHLLCERALGSESKWATYISLLPDQAQHPLMWDASQLAWLTGSPMLKTLDDRHRQVQEDMKVLLKAGVEDLPLAKAYKAKTGSSLITLPSVRWASATLLSRSFFLDPKRMVGKITEATANPWGHPENPGAQHFNDILALVPLADLLPHCSSTGPESCLHWDAPQSAATLAAHRAYKAGEEVVCSYGLRLCPVDMLLDHGRVDAMHYSHKIEADPYVLVRPRSERNSELLDAFMHLQGEDAHHHHRLIISEDGPDEMCRTWLRAAVAGDSALISAGWTVNATHRNTDLAARAGLNLKPVSRITEGTLLARLKDYIQWQLVQYPSCRSVDEEELQKPGTTWLRAQTLRALISEKKALQGALKKVELWIQFIKDEVPLEEMYSEATVEAYSSMEYEGEDLSEEERFLGRRRHTESPQL